MYFDILEHCLFHHLVLLVLIYLLSFLYNFLVPHMLLLVIGGWYSRTHCQTLIIHSLTIFPLFPQRLGHWARVYSNNAIKFRCLFQFFPLAFFKGVHTPFRIHNFFIFHNTVILLNGWMIAWFIRPILISNGLAEHPPESNNFLFPLFFLCHHWCINSLGPHVHLPCWFTFILKELVLYVQAVSMLYLLYTWSFEQFPLNFLFSNFQLVDKRRGQNIPTLPHKSLLFGRTDGFLLIIVLVDQKDVQSMALFLQHPESMDTDFQFL